jgi:hypothetical protein
LLLPEVTAHLPLELMKALNLLRREYATHLGANIRVQPDLIRMRGRERLSGTPDLRFVVGLVHYCSIQRLARLPYPSARRNNVVVVAAPNLLDSHLLRGRKPNRLHHPLL